MYTAYASSIAGAWGVDEVEGVCEVGGMSHSGERTSGWKSANDGHDGLGDAAGLVPVADDGSEEIHDALRVAEDLLNVRKDRVDGLGLDDGLVAQAPQAALFVREHRLKKGCRMRGTIVGNTNIDDKLQASKVRLLGLCVCVRE